MSEHRYVICSNNTDAGKTLVSAILAYGLPAAYWKPVQCGIATDLQTVKSYSGSSKKIKFIPEVYALSSPESPHSAAAKEGVYIDKDKLMLTQLSDDLIVETAGGVMTPLNNEYLFIDIIGMWSLPVIIVLDLYLGGISHSLLTISALKERGIPIKGIVFNKTLECDASRYILAYTGQHCIGYIPHLDLDTFDIEDVFNTYIRL